MPHESSDDTKVQAVPRPFYRSITIAALGVVFGDIGTSPLYAIREAFHGTHAIPPTPANILGVLSLILWSLIVIITFKYIGFVMKADNKGEGGVLALTALAFSSRVTPRNKLGQAFMFLGLFGSALLVGDGIITPAISVLSAVEGLEVATPFFSPYIVPITLVVLATLFLNQHFGTGRLGAVFGIIVSAWFLVLASLGIHGIIGNPAVLSAFNPSYAVSFFLQNGFQGMVALGAVFLAVTGGEALYADMGHFGRAPIRKAWFFAAFPALVLNYLGQGALLLNSPEHAINPFYRLAPTWALYPLVMMATIATVIASQAVISGVFSMARQAIQLGYAPRFRIVHTSSEEIGQIYIPKVNLALFVMTCWLVMEFRSSGALAAAYGIAVSTTMTITTLLAGAIAFNQWKWKAHKVVAVFLFFLIVDLIFLVANASKIADGGWLPLTVGIVVFTLMTTWRRGRQILRQRMHQKSLPFTQFLQQLQNEPPACVKGVAFFMTGDPDGTPPALLHNVKHNKVLHTKNVLMTVLTEDSPTVPKKDRVHVELIDKQFSRVTAHYGFMETPRISEVIRACARQGLSVKLTDITFFLGRETLLPTATPGMAIWREKIFAFMSQNAERATAYFDIPTHQVVEMGIQVEL